jgi:hypothetical protein
MDKLLQSKIDKLATHFGNQLGIASALRIDSAAVAQWRHHGIPPRRAIEIEILTDGKFKAVDLIGGHINDKG